MANKLIYLFLIVSIVLSLQFVSAGAGVCRDINLTSTSGVQNATIVVNMTDNEINLDYQIQVYEGNCLARTTRTKATLLETGTGYSIFTFLANLNGGTDEYSIIYNDTETANNSYYSLVDDHCEFDDVYGNCSWVIDSSKPNFIGKVDDGVLNFKSSAGQGIFKSLTNISGAKDFIVKTKNAPSNDFWLISYGAFHVPAIDFRVMAFHHDLRAAFKKDYFQWDDAGGTARSLIAENGGSDGEWRISVANVIDSGGIVNSVSYNTSGNVEGNGTNPAGQGVNMTANRTFIIKTGTSITANQSMDYIRIYDYEANHLSLNNHPTYQFGILQDANPSPVVSIVYPENTTYSSVVTELKYTASDGTLDACWYSLDLGVTNTTITCGDNVTGISVNDGSHTWNVYANDSADKEGLDQITFLQDTSPPSVDLDSPPNLSHVNQPTNLTVTITDLSGIQNATLFVLNATDNSLINQTTFNVPATPTSASVGTVINLTADTYIWYYTTSDIHGYENVSSNRTLIVDFTDPLITWYNPVQFSVPVTPTPTFQINASIEDTYLDAINVTVYNSSDEVTFNNFTGNLTSSIEWVRDVITLTEGNNTIQICARDSLESSPVINDTAKFTKTNAEETIFEMPNGNNVTREIIIRDEFGNKLSAEFVNLVTTEEFVDGGRHYKTAWEIDDIGEGYLEIEMYDDFNGLELLMDRGVIRVVNRDRNYYWRFDDMTQAGFDVEYTYNVLESKVEIKVTKGSYEVVGGRWIIDPLVAGLNTVCSNETVTLDTTAPEGESGGFVGIGGYTGSGTTPTNNTFTNQPSLNFSVNASDIHGIDNITLIVLNETDDIINETFIDIPSVYGSSLTEILFGIIYYFFYEGVYNWYFTVADSVGNLLTTTEAMVTYDITEPSGNIVYPLNTTYPQTITELNYTSSDLNPESCWYSTDIGVTNNSVSCGTNVTGLSSVEGSNKWYLWMNDSASNINESSVIFTQDTTPPNIEIIYPVNSNFYITFNLLLNISVSNGNSSVWFSRDNGLTNTSYTSPTLVIFLEGENNVTAYVNDSVGNQNSTSVLFTVDTITPVVTVIYVENISTTFFPVNITLNYTITDTNISTCWYELDSNFSVRGFNNSLSVENLTFTGNENITRYLEIPKNTTISSTNLDLTGYSVNDSSFCYQEGANESDQRGSDGNCNINYSGTYTTAETGGSIIDVANMFDGDYSTYGYYSSDARFIVNYSKPPSSAGAIWSTRDGITDRNFTLPDGCFNAFSDKIQLYHRGVTAGGIIQHACWNGDTWVQLFIAYTPPNYRLYEEAIYWNYTNYPSNVTLNLGNETIFNYSSPLETTVSLDDFSSTLNSALNGGLCSCEGCSLVGDNCIVPFQFHSDTEGRLGYSDLIFSSGFSGNLNCSATTVEVPVYREWYHNLTVYGEDLGGLVGNDVGINYILNHNYSQNYQNDETMEGTTENFNLTVGMTESWVTVAYLIYNEVAYISDTVNVINGDYIFTKDLTIPSGLGNSTGKNATWYWNYTIEGNSYWVENYSTSSNNQTVYSLGLDNCSSYNNTILNLTLYDEETALVMNVSLNPIIEVDLSLRNQDDLTSVFDFNHTWVNATTGQVCLLTGLLNNSEYRIDFTVSYEADGYVKEFYYMDNGTLDNSSNFNSYTTHTIGLYDLLTVDSTSFLFEFTDTNGLPVSEAIVHTYRKYIGEGIFREIERSRQDEGGETHVHLVEEDEIYYFTITNGGTILYTSSTYNAKCLSVPCSIKLDSLPDGLDFSEDWDNFAGGTYSISSNRDTETVSLDFIAEEVTNVNLTVWSYELGSSGEYISVPIDSSTVSATAGTVQVAIPQEYLDSQLYASFHADEEHVKSSWIEDMGRTGQEIFGTFGVLLTALIVIAFALMSITEGIPMIFFVILALVISGIMKLMDMNWLAFISITIGGIILIVKLAKRRGVQ